MAADFQPCEICGGADWADGYVGPVRDGKFGNHRNTATVAHCKTCGVARLDEASCKEAVFYESGSYRDLVNADQEVETYYLEHDHLQIFSLHSVFALGLRGSTIVDVGCGAGSFLDHVASLAGATIAVEPTSYFREHLAARGHVVFPYAADAQADHAASADIVTSFQVIEHVAEPRRFLEDIRQLLRPGGHAVITTPNRDDILLDILPDEFPAFFYRTVHRWYFDGASLADCARRAGFAAIETRYVHRYPMSNALHWLRDRRPRGTNPMTGIDTLADHQWQAYLETSGRADTLVTILTA